MWAGALVIQPFMDAGGVPDRRWQNYQSARHLACSYRFGRLMAAGWAHINHVRGKSRIYAEISEVNPSISTRISAMR